MSARTPLNGSTRNIESTRTGSLPSARKSTPPAATVTASAMSGERTLIASDGDLGGPRAGSREASARAARPPVRGPPGHSPLIHSPIRSTVASAVAIEGERRPFAMTWSRSADREELLELLGDDEHGAAGVAQREELGADLRRRADVDAPGRLRHDEHLRHGVELAADDVLLEVPAGEARAPPRPVPTPSPSIAG